MDARHWAGLLAVGILSAACQPKAPPPATAPAMSTEQVLEQVRGSYRRVDPDARVGRVTAVIADVDLVAVGEIKLDGFRIGDFVSVIDAGQNIIANGRVVAITADSLHVRYDKASAKRDPRDGDLAVATTLKR